MARTGISFAEVEVAAQTILAQGKNPTIERVRQQLGTGSHSTIAKHLADWKQLRNSIESEPTKLTPPDPVNQAVKQVWRQIQAETNDKIQHVESEAQAKISTTQAENEKLITDNDQLQKSLQLIQTENKALIKTVNQLEKTKLSVTEKNNAAQDKITLLQQSLKDLKEERAHGLQAVVVSKDKLIADLKLKAERLRTEKTALYRHEKEFTKTSNLLECKLVKQAAELETLKLENKDLQKLLKASQAKLSTVNRHDVQTNKLLTAEKVKLNLHSKLVKSLELDKKSLQKQVQSLTKMLPST